MVDGNKAGEVWAIVLSADGQYLAATSFDGRINVWDNLADGAKIKEFETKGSFGMSIDLVSSLECKYLTVLNLTSRSLPTEDLRRLDMRTAVSTSLTTIPENWLILSWVRMNAALKSSCANQG